MAKPIGTKIEIEVFSYRELLQLEAEDPKDSEIKRAVDEVRIRLSDWVTENGVISDYVWNQLWKPALEQIGFRDVEMRYRGFWSQGDGASFTSNWVNLGDLVSFMTSDIEASDIIPALASDPDKEDFRGWLRKKLSWDHNQVEHNYQALMDPEIDFSVRVVRSCSTYCHENTCRVECDNNTDLPAELVNALMKDLERFRYAVCQAIYSDLEEEYDHLTSNEYLIEFDEANEYRWDRRGRLM